MSNIITYHDLAEAEQAISNDRICRQVGGHIAKKYPDRKWMVEVVDNGRVCKIRLPHISMEYGMQFRIMDLMEFNLRKAERMAGEILERFNLTRGRTDNSDLVGLHRNIRGEVVGAAMGDIAASQAIYKQIVDYRGRPMGAANA